MKSFAAKAPDPAVAAFLKSRIDNAFGIVDKHLAGRDFVVGDAFTIADMCVRARGAPAWTYAELQKKADAIAHVLVAECGLVPGNRVLLRAANQPMLVACWFAVVKAGGIAVATMPMLRAKELGQIIEKARVTIALCDIALRAELDAAATAVATVPEGPAAATRLDHIVCFGDTSAPDGLEARMARGAVLLDPSVRGIQPAGDRLRLLDPGDDLPEDRLSTVSGLPDSAGLLPSGEHLSHAADGAPRRG